MPGKQKDKHQSMGLWTAASIGVGAMIGAGIFALIGIAVDIAGKGAYWSFIIAGIIALLTTYSVARLAVSFPSKGGRVEFLNQGYGKGIFSGGLNVLMWLGYIIVTSLYARAFGEYGTALFGLPQDGIWVNVLSTGVLLLFLLINFVGASIVGGSELILVGAKVLILLFFGIAGLYVADYSRPLAAAETDFSDIILAAGVIFMSYEGFGLVANTAEDLKNPRKNLTKALFISVIIAMAVYVMVTVSVLANLSISQILEAKEYVLAKAAKPVVGSAGFVIMGIAALFSTSSAINATIYGPVYMLQETARAKQLPLIFTKSLFGHHSGTALMITGIVILLISNLLTLEIIAETGSLIFLIIYSAVNGANIRLYKKTKSKGWISWLALAGTLFAFGALLYYEVLKGGLSVYVMGGLILAVFIYEWLYQRYREKHPKTVKSEKQKEN
jgi:amino acid transporter